MNKHSIIPAVKISILALVILGGYNFAFLNRPAPALADCTPAWDCSDWSVCADSVQTRSCHDDNGCGTEIGRPVESAECDSTAPGTVTDLVAS